MPNTGDMVMYGVGITDWPTWPQPHAPIPPVDITFATPPRVTLLRERAEAVGRWYADLLPLTKKQRMAHSRPCLLWEALEATAWAKTAGLPAQTDEALCAMWLRGEVLRG